MYKILIGFVILAIITTGCISTNVTLHDQTVQIMNKHEDTDQRTIVDQTGSILIVSCDDCISTFYIWESLEIGQVYKCDLVPNGLGEYRWVENCTKGGEHR